MISNRSQISRFALLALVAAWIAGASSADERIDRVERGLLPTAVEKSRLGESFSIQQRMEDAGVPGLSIAVIDGGAIAWARGYGVLDRESGHEVTPDTLFLAGSISKPIAATAALRLVQEGKLDLDADINQRLTSWKVPPAEEASGEKVTLRRLLTHSAGLTVHGFPGYDRKVEIPEIVQILNGEKPANTAAVLVDLEPGTQWRYSGGGYTVMQLLVSEVSQQPFERFLQQKVLAAFGMQSSTFENPLPRKLHQQAASGHWPNGNPVPGGWHVYPEMAAAGLWTTASDLARWAIAIQKASAGTSNPVLSQETTAEMLTKHLNDWGLGPGLAGDGEELRFQHGGRDEGFDAHLVAFREQGKGAAILMNANNNTGLIGEIVASIAREYEWPGYPVPKQRGYVVLPKEELEAYRGSYQLDHGDGQLRLYVWQGSLWASRPGLRLELLPTKPDEFFGRGTDAEIWFERSGEGTIVGLRYELFGQSGTAKRN